MVSEIDSSITLTDVNMKRIGIVNNETKGIKDVTTTIGLSGICIAIDAAKYARTNNHVIGVTAELTSSTFDTRLPIAA